MTTRHAILPILATLTLLAPVACDDAALVVDENLLLSDDPDEVDAALDAAADDLAAGLDPSLATCATCKSAGNFSATNYFVGANRNFSLTTQFTQDAWVYRTGTSPALGVITSFGHGFGLAEANGTLHVLQSYPGAFCNTAIPIPLNRWTHIAQSFNSAVGNKIYVNGIEKAHGCNVLTKQFSAGNFEVGSTAGSSYVFPGHIDQVRVWNVARSATDIQRQMFNDNAANQGANLKAFYKLNGNGTDSATGGVALTITGSPWNAATGLAAGAQVGDGVRSFVNPTTKTAYRFWTFLGTYAFYTGAGGCPATNGTAAGFGWSLATIKDAAEDTFIDTAINTFADEMNNPGFKTAELWIGLKDKDGDKIYTEATDWQRSEASIYTEFGAVPTAASLCVVDNAVVGTTYDTWKAISCADTSKRGAICEYKF